MDEEYNRGAHPKYIVKYFAKKHRSDIKKGKFRFGSLESYRPTDGKVFRLSDTTDGVDINAIEGIPIPGKSGDVFVPTAGILGPGNSSMIISDCVFGLPLGETKVLTTRSELNYHVGCFTKGPYSPKHHRQMMYGAVNPNGSFYKGDKNLECAAIIDLEKFIYAFRLKGAKFDDHKLYTDIKVGPVQYRDKVHISDNRHIDLRKGPSFRKAIAIKPLEYEIENEFRMILYQ